MRSRPHNALHLDVSHSGTSTLAQCDGGATGVPPPISCQISSSPLRIGGRRYPRTRAIFLAGHKIPTQQHELVVPLETGF